jgi:hypothetical protein
VVLSEDGPVVSIVVTGVVVLSENGSVVSTVVVGKTTLIALSLISARTV